MPANTNYTEILTTTIESRRKKAQDNVTKNNGLLTQLMKKGRILRFSGGVKILEEMVTAENPNGGAYSGYDQLPTQQSDGISAAEFQIKQYAVPVTISGLEQLQNSGDQAMFDLMATRIDAAEMTMKNLISQGLYGDGTAFSGKSITGLDAAIETTATASQTSTYGNIPRSSNSFWRNYCEGSITLPTSTTIQPVMNRFWANTTRGTDSPDLIIADNNYWAAYTGSLQLLQRFTGGADSASLGFPSLKFMSADVILDGGIGGFAYSNSTTGGTMYFVNSKFLKYRPHGDREFVPLDGDRTSVNQDALVKIIGWAGNLTCSGAKFLGRAFTT